MKSINTYYENFKTLQAFCTKHTIEDSSSLLIQVFTSKNDKFFIQKLLNELISILPQAAIIGSTTDGEIMNGEVSTSTTVLSFTQFKHTKLKMDTAVHTKDGYFSGQSLAKSLIQEDTKLLIAFADGLQTNGEVFLKGVHSVSSDVIVAGGLAGDNAAFTGTYVFTKGKIISKGAVAVSLNSDILTVSNGYSFNWRRIGKELTITKAKDNCVYTINNKTAVEMYAYYLGEEMATELPSIGMEFPLILTRNGIKIARAVLAKHNDGSLVFAGNLQTGDKVQFGYGNPLDILNHSDEIFNQIQEKPSETIFIYSCMARRHFMPDTIHEEISPLQSIAPTAGFFTYGEFYTGDRKELLNESMTIVSLSEENTVSPPKVSTLPHNSTTQSSMNALINLVNRTTKEAIEQESLKQARDTFEKLFENSADGIILLEDDIFVRCNQKMLDIFGYETEEKFVTAKAYQLFPRKQPDGSYSLIKLKKIRELAKKNGSHQFEWVHLNKNNETFWVDIMLTYLVLNDKETLYMVYRDITHRKELETENILIKEQMELAFEGSRDGLWDWNLIDNNIYFSIRWKEMLGYSDDEFENNLDTWKKNVHPDDLKEVMKEVQLNVEGKIDLFETKYRLRHKDGHWVWIYSRGKIHFNSRGKAIRMLGAHTDITKEKEDELKLIEQGQIIKQLKERQELALTGSKTAVLDWDFRDNSMYISPSWKEMLGYRDDELPNRTLTWFERAHPDDKKMILSSLRKHEQEHLRYFENTHRLKHKDGHWTWVLGRAQISYDKNGKKLRMIGTHTDITEEKELQLKYSHQGQIIEQIHDGIIATDLKGNILSWNAGAEILFEYTQSEVIGKHISLIYQQEDIQGLRKDIRASLSDTGLYCGDLIFVKKSKETISVALSLSTLKDENDKAIGMIGINQDITQRKKAEDALQEAKEKAEESAKSKSLFLANMSHEIRTPMNAILGFIDLLKAKETGKESKKYIDIIDSSSKGLLKILEDILDFSKIESGKLEIDKIDFNIKKEFEIIIHTFLAKCSENDIEFSLNLDKNLPESIHTDPLRVKQVIFNLLSNAIKFTNKGKKIIVNINYKDDYLHVSVKDEGKGIAKNKLSHIFESFSQEDSSTTRVYGGTGLGLTISYELVKLLGGELKVKSEVDVGSEFYFSIKAAVGKEIKNSEETLENITFDNKKILLAEDVKTSQMFMNIILGELNFKVDIANDGIEAVEAFKQNKYDVILMDENMPNLNGIGATRQILEIEAQNNLPHIPIVALTANALKGDKERFLEAGMDAYLTKPVDKNHLVKALKNVLSKTL